MSSTGSHRKVGRVVALWRYPVKSMAPEALTEVEVSWFGLAGDRRWAFVRAGVEQSGFPWLTLRQNAALCHYVPTFVDPSRPDASATTVRTPSGARFDIADPALAADLGGARLLRHDRGVFDTFPLSLITTRTIAWLGERVAELGGTNVELDPQRFRPNFLIEPENEVPFAEETWVGRELRIGTLRLRVDKRDGRCVVTTIDPATGERDPAILRVIAQERAGCLGVYASTTSPGRVAVGDELLLETVEPF
jgi:uncharacterized protein YcbX